MREADGRARRPTQCDGTRASDCRTGKKFTSAGGSGWRLRLLLTALLVIAAAGSATARPGPFDALPIIEIPLEPEDQRRGGSALSWHAAFDDTVLYGGTVWSPDSMRWEALRDSHWTFDTGVGSSINTGGNPNKPIGYHQTMEGWFGIDRTLNPQPYFRRSSTCAISGSFSLWAGVTAGEAGQPCYATGQGYGNYWNLVVSKSFSYPGSGSVAFSFDFAVDSEPTYDFAYAEIDTSGTGAMEPIVLWTQDGLVSGTISFVLNPGSEMRSTPGAYRVLLRASSDGGYSDEDGLYPSACGLVAFDNVVAGADTTDFEFGMNGWAQELEVTGVGDFSHLADLASLPAPTTFCPCGHADSVLVFFDESAGNPLEQDNIAVSPWIDLLEGGDVGRPGKLFLYDVYAELPLGNYTFIQLRARYYPEVCGGTGLLQTSTFRDQNVIFYFGEAPFCNPTNAPRLRDYSGVIPSHAEQVQVAWGIINLCMSAPFGWPCSGITNTTPWIDNVSLGVFGFPNAPAIRTEPYLRFHDNFASDGTGNLHSPGRIDIAIVKNGSTAVAGAVFGDTLVAISSGSNVEVRLIFRVKPGPFTSGAALAAEATRWTPEPGLSASYGGPWYSARMDTAQRGASVFPSLWMSAFHEADPGFEGHDQALDPSDPNRLANDILPDHLLTPGSRIDYFVAARYLPPDARNPGGQWWSLESDTTGGRFHEAEIFPSAGMDSTWNCLLYVDARDDRDFREQALEEQSLDTVLGPVGLGFEGAAYDRWDVLAPTSNQLTFARPLSSINGVSQIQIFLYGVIVWHMGSLTNSALMSSSAQILYPWHVLPSTQPKYFWATGEGFAQSLNSGSATARKFLNESLGATLNCSSIRLEGCPTGTAVDTTFCLPTSVVSGAWFDEPDGIWIRGNGCPDLSQSDLLGLYPGMAGVRGQLAYEKNGVTQAFASISREVPWGFGRTVLDGFSFGRTRGNSGSSEAGCDDVSAAYDRVGAVLGWFGSPVRCRLRSGPVDVPDGQLPSPPARPALGPAHPNPTPGAARVSLVNATPNARVRLDILDVSGRLVRTLVNGPLAAGPHELTWDGRAADGRLVADGLYFYRMTTDGFTEARKLVVLR